MTAKLNFQGGRIILGTAFAGYKFGIFEAGSSTPKTTYKDSALTVGNENVHPVVLDANGAAQIWFSGNAKAVFYTNADVVVYTDDNINLEDSQDASGEYNLLLNPSFEVDTDGSGVPDNWDRTLYTSGAFALDTTTQAHGDTSAKFTSTGSGGGYLTSSNNFAVSPLKQMLLSFSTKSSAADVRNVVEVLWYKADGSASSTASTTAYDDSTTNPTSWTQKRYPITVPSDAYFAKLRVTGCHSSDATAGSTWFDDVEFREGAMSSQGDIEYMGSGLKVARRAIGNSGQALAVDAAGTGLEWWAPRNHIAGLTMSNNVSDATNDLDIAVGECSDSTNVTVIKVTSAITKRLDATFAAGTNQGGLDTGAKANSTWYHVFAIKKDSDGAGDVLFSISFASPTMPSGYTYKRRIGSIRTSSGGVILQFAQFGDEFLLDDPALDVDTTNPGTSAVTQTLTNVPTGDNMLAIVNVIFGNHAGSGVALYASSLTQDDEPASTSAAPLAQGNSTPSNFAGWGGRIMTNSSSQIRTRINNSDGTTVVRIATRGWVDFRGKKA